MTVLVIAAVWLDRGRHGLVSDAYGISAHPATLVIDAEGIVRAIQAGPFDAVELENQIDTLVAG